MYGVSVTFPLPSLRRSAYCLANSSACSARSFSSTKRSFPVLVRSTTFPNATVRFTCAVRFSRSTASQRRASASDNLIPVKNTNS
ncbi:hypothetical protein D3C77_430610 [compost metagenome]